MALSPSTTTPPPLPWRSHLSPLTMDLPGLDSRPGKVIAAEIWRHFSSPVSFDPLSSPLEFFLVLSFGRCKYRLSKLSVAYILQAVIGGDAPSFRVLQLGDRVFRFSVHSRQVGFHVYKLRSYECSAFKIFFNLWHRGGPSFRSEFWDGKLNNPKNGLRW